MPGFARVAMVDMRERSHLLQDRKVRRAEGCAMISSGAEAPRSGEGLVGAGLLGGELRVARERLGWALADVSLRLRIRMAFLLAIEAGRFQDLPGHAYALGFVRSYAVLLGLDADEVTRRFRAEAREITGRTPLEFPAPVPDRGVPAGAVVFLGCVLAVVAYIGWYRASGEQPNAAMVERVPDRLAPLAALPLAPVPPTPTPAPLVETPPPTPSGLLGLPSYPPTSAGAAMPPPSFSMPPSFPVAGANAPVPAVGTGAVGDSPTTAPMSADDGKIVIRARADAWVQVRDKAGQTLLNRVLRPGETYNVPPRQQLLFTTGNAGGVDLVVDGVTAPALGGTGVVRRDLPLDADAIRAGKLPTAKSAPP